MFEINLGRLGRDHALRELANCGPECFVMGRKLKVQLRRYLE